MLVVTWTPPAAASGSPPAGKPDHPVPNSSGTGPAGPASNTLHPAGEILTAFILPHLAALACSRLGTAQLRGQAGRALTTPQQLPGFSPCPSLGQQVPVQSSDEPR